MVPDGITKTVSDVKAKAQDLQWQIDKLKLKMEDLKKSVRNGKTQVANAITTKGVDTDSTDTFNTMATNILQINSGDGGYSMGPIVPGEFTNIENYFLSTVVNTLLDMHVPDAVSIIQGIVGHYYDVETDEVRNVLIGNVTHTINRDKWYDSDGNICVSGYSNGTTWIPYGVTTTANECPSEEVCVINPSGDTVFTLNLFCLGNTDGSHILERDEDIITDICIRVKNYDTKIIVSKTDMSTSINDSTGAIVVDQDTGTSSGDIVEDACTDMTSFTRRNVTVNENVYIGCLTPSESRYPSMIFVQGGSVGGPCNQGCFCLYSEMDGFSIVENTMDSSTAQVTSVTTKNAVRNCCSFGGLLQSGSSASFPYNLVPVVQGYFETSDSTIGNITYEGGDYGLYSLQPRYTDYIHIKNEFIARDIDSLTSTKVLSDYLYLMNGVPDDAGNLKVLIPDSDLFPDGVFIVFLQVAIYIPDGNSGSNDYAYSSLSNFHKGLISNKAICAALDELEDKMTIDNTITENSSNAVTSNAVYESKLAFEEAVA